MPESTPAPPTDTGRASVVTATHGRHRELEHLHESLSRARCRPRQLVVVAVEDEDLVTWSPDDGVPVTVVPLSGRPEGIPWAAAKNAGATAALREGAELVVFVETAAELRDDTIAAFERAATSSDGVWWAAPEQAPADAAAPEHLESAAFAVSLGAWARLGGFCEDYVGSGFEDLDLARAAQAAGLRLGPAPDAVVRRAGVGVGARDEHALARNAELHRSRWGIRPAGEGGGW